MLMEELQFWNLSIADLNLDKDECNTCIEEDFLWIESRIPPPREPASRLIRYRYNLWCFLTDPLGPYTKYRKLSIAFAVMSIIFTILFMVLFGLSTKPTFREKINQSGGLAPNVTMQSSIDDKTPNCDDDLKIACFVESQPLPWIKICLQILMCFFVVDTVVRLVVCPDLKIYLHSVINLVDILCCVCLIAIIPVLVKVEQQQNLQKEWAMAEIVLEGVQVLRIFKVLQVGTV
jgi:hypothetical protein